MSWEERTAGCHGVANVTFTKKAWGARHGFCALDASYYLRRGNIYRWTIPITPMELSVFIIFLAYHYGPSRIRFILPPSFLLLFFVVSRRSHAATATLCRCNPPWSIAWLGCDRVCGLFRAGLAVVLLAAAGLLRKKLLKKRGLLGAGFGLRRKLRLQIRHFVAKAHIVRRAVAGFANLVALLLLPDAELILRAIGADQRGILRPHDLGCPFLKRNRTRPKLHDRTVGLPVVTLDSGALAAGRIRLRFKNRGRLPPFGFLTPQRRRENRAMIAAKVAALVTLCFNHIGIRATTRKRKHFRTIGRGSNDAIDIVAAEKLLHMSLTLASLSTLVPVVGTTHADIQSCRLTA